MRAFYAGAPRGDRPRKQDRRLKGAGPVASGQRPRAYFRILAAQFITLPACLPVSMPDASHSSFLASMHDW